MTLLPHCPGLKAPVCIFLCCWLTTLTTLRLHLKLFPSAFWGFSLVYEQQKNWGEQHFLIPCPVFCMCLGFLTAVGKEKTKYVKFHYLATSEMSLITALESVCHRPDMKLVVSVKDYKFFLAHDTLETCVTHPWGDKHHFLGGVLKTFESRVKHVFCFLWLVCHNPRFLVIKLSQVFFPICIIVFSNVLLVRRASFLFTLSQHFEKRINLTSSWRSQRCSGLKSRS